MILWHSLSIVGQYLDLLDTQLTESIFFILVWFLDSCRILVKANEKLQTSFFVTLKVLINLVSSIVRALTHQSGTPIPIGVVTLKTKSIILVI